PKEFEKAVDILLVQGQAGGFELDDFAALGERIVTSMAGTGGLGVEGARDLGALMQMVRKGSGGPEEAATAFESYVNNLRDPEVVKKLRERGGIKVFEDDNPDKMRPLLDLTKEIIKESG